MNSFLHGLNVTLIINRLVISEYLFILLGITSTISSLIILRKWNNTLKLNIYLTPTK